MNLFKILTAGTVIGLIVATFRDFEGDGWIVPGRELLGEGGSDFDGREPVLGYDGMDEETLVEWIDDAGLERDDLLRMLRYEAGGDGRRTVLEAIIDRI